MATIKSRRAVNKTLRASKKLYKAFAARMEDKFERISELESDLVVTNIQDRHDSHHLAEDVVEKITALGPCSGKFEIIRVTRLGPTIAQTLDGQVTRPQNHGG